MNTALFELISPDVASSARSESSPPTQADHLTLPETDQLLARLRYSGTERTIWDWKLKGELPGYETTSKDPSLDLNRRAVYREAYQQERARTVQERATRIAALPFWRRAVEHIRSFNPGATKERAHNFAARVVGQGPLDGSTPDISRPPRYLPWRDMREREPGQGVAPSERKRSVFVVAGLAGVALVLGAQVHSSVNANAEKADMFGERIEELFYPTYNDAGNTNDQGVGTQESGHTAR